MNNFSFSFFGGIKCQKWGYNEQERLCQYARYYVWDFHERVDRSDVPHPNIFAQATAFPQPIGALSQFLRLPSPRLPHMSILQ